MPKPITLETVAEGAVEEVWQVELARVLENIEDPNTDWKQKRSISLTFIFEPDEERKVANLEVRATAKLAGLRGRSTVVYLGRQHGRLVAVEPAHQEDMFTPVREVAEVKLMSVGNVVEKEE